MFYLYFLSIYSPHEKTFSIHEKNRLIPVCSIMITFFHIYKTSFISANFLRMTKFRKTPSLPSWEAFCHPCIFPIISSKSFPATSSLDCSGSSVAPSAVISVTTLVSPPNPAPCTLRLLATIISTFFFISF